MFDLRRLTLDEFTQLLAGQHSWQARARIIANALDEAPVGTTITVPSINPALPPRYEARKARMDGLEWKTTSHALRPKRGGGVKAEIGIATTAGWGFALDVAFHFEGRRGFADNRIDQVIRCAWKTIQACDEPWPLPSEADPIHFRQLIQIQPPQLPDPRAQQGEPVTL